MIRLYFRGILFQVLMVMVSGKLMLIGVILWYGGGADNAAV